jgi:hypothetical protein
MRAISGTDLESSHLLYNPHRALDTVVGMGAVPRRLFRVFYPLWRVQVEGLQRIATDFEELEWFIERGVYEAGLRSLQELAWFFGLEERFVRKLVGFLKAIYHIRGTENHLSLTKLGEDSLKAKVRLQEQEFSTVLYFDALGSRPLTREHYSVPVYTELPDDAPFFAIYPHFFRWDVEALERLAHRPDKDQYNVPDEIITLDDRDRDLAYLPIYIVERRSGEPKHVPPFLVFSRVRGRRDAVLEEAVNEEPLVRVPLCESSRYSLTEAVEAAMDRRGLQQSDWSLQLDGPWGAQVTVDAQVLRPSMYSVSDSEGIGQLTTRDVGRYLRAYDWCVWVTCEDARVRRQAAIEHLLEWFQHVTARPSAEDLLRRLDVLGQRLRIRSISIDTLMQEAEQRHLGRALERLDALVIGGEEA